MYDAAKQGNGRLAEHLIYMIFESYKVTVEDVKE